MNTCLFMNCDRPVMRDGERVCAVHFRWAYIVLKDDRYRTEPPPVVTELGVQARMFHD